MKNERKIIITENCLDYGDNTETLEKLLPEMVLTIAFACRKLEKPILNIVMAIVGTYMKTENPEDFGYEIKDSKRSDNQ